MHATNSGIAQIRSKILVPLLAILIASQLNACIPLVIGTATVTAIDLISERRTLRRNIDDNALEFKLRNKLKSEETLDDAVNISVTIINGIVLLTGEVHNDEQRQHAEQVARGFEDTQNVVNELELSGKTNLTSRINDTYLTSKVKTKLLRSDDVPSTNIKVVTERAKVYLLGIVARAEADAAVEVASSVSGVSRIVKVFEYLD